MRGLSPVARSMAFSLKNCWPNWGTNNIFYFFPYFLLLSQHFLLLSKYFLLTSPSISWPTSGHQCGAYGRWRALWPSPASPKSPRPPGGSWASPWWCRSGFRGARCGARGGVGGAGWCEVSVGEGDLLLRRKMFWKKWNKRDLVF